MDTDAPKCVVCFTHVDIVKKCGKCKKRIYCDKQCQKSDWKSHKHWCGKSGEINIDYEIKSTHNKGLGTFALRKFKRGDKIMVEKPVMKSVHDNLTKNIHKEVMKLMPQNGNIEDKFYSNTISCAENSTIYNRDVGLFLNMSRINHSCVGNTNHKFIPEYGVKILVASRDIDIGEEITFSYIQANINKYVNGNRQEFLLKKWNFTCTCKCCTSPEMNKKLSRMYELDDMINSPDLSTNSALKIGNELIKIYDELQMSPIFYVRTYYDMFQHANMKFDTTHLAKKYVQLALDYNIIFHGSDVKCDAIDNMKRYVKDQSSHNTYLIKEKNRRIS
jgi:hypothetical protein